MHLAPSESGSFLVTFSALVGMRGETILIFRQPDLRLWLRCWQMKRAATPCGGEGHWSVQLDQQPFKQVS